MTTIQLTSTYEVVECANCHMTFGLPQWYAVDLRRSHKSFYCPKGHSLSWGGESDIERAERLRKNAMSREEQAWTAMAAARDQERAASRSNAALRGHLTRSRNKIAAGVCPVGNCRRPFTNVREHIAHQHPKWHLTDPETGKQVEL